MWSMPQCMLSENSEADSKFLYIAHIERSPYLASNSAVLVPTWFYGA